MPSSKNSARELWPRKAPAAPGHGHGAGFTGTSMHPVGAVLLTQQKATSRSMPTIMRGYPKVLVTLWL